MLLFSDEDRIEAIGQANIARPVVVTPSRPSECGKIEKKRENMPKLCVRACKDNPEMKIVHLTHDPFSFRISGPLAYTHARRFFGSPTFFHFTEHYRTLGREKSVRSVQRCTIFVADHRPI